MADLVMRFTVNEEDVGPNPTSPAEVFIWQKIHFL